MLSFSGRTKIFAGTEPVDLRKSFDGLYAVVRDVIDRDPLSGHVFVFMNKNRNRLKALFWDGTGLIVVAKRLERGKFNRMNTLKGQVIKMSASEFGLLLEGADLTKRFVESPREFRQFSVS